MNKIRTRYQRMELAVKMAEHLRTHADPLVSETALAITYALGAPTSTLNNVLDQFPKFARPLIESVSKTPDAGAGLLQKIRKVRAGKSAL